MAPLLGSGWYCRYFLTSIVIDLSGINQLLTCT
jgi:hypothetical protein